MTTLPQAFCDRMKETLGREYEVFLACYEKPHLRGIRLNPQKCGEDLLLIDENQIQYETKITDITKDTISAEILKSYKSNRKLPFNLYLVQSPLRSDAQNILIEKATELGAAGVFPVLSDNCALNKAV